MVKRTPMDDEGKARIMSAAARNPDSDTVACAIKTSDLRRCVRSRVKKVWQ
jgi:hypothetical protein